MNDTPDSVDLAIHLERLGVARRSYNSTMASTGQSTEQAPQAQDTSPGMRVPSEIVGKSQEIVNLLAEIMHVPSALVMKVEPPISRFLCPASRTGIYISRTKYRLSIRG
jgi:hypothetical protein